MAESATIQSRIKREQGRINKKLKEERDKLKEAPKMKGRFQNIECPTAPLEFTYLGKSYNLQSGMVYELPAPIVKHITELSIPVYKRKEELDENGNVQKELVGQRHRFAFVTVFEDDLKELQEKAAKSEEEPEKRGRKKQ